MKYAFITLAIFSVWLGTILLALAQPEIGIFLPIFSILMTVLLFWIGFRKKSS